ncbi:putative EGF-like domain protein [Trichinella nativa]|uniref:Putative EGF-like domain protein n=1 Tax=Trichinella nativa TaxID=6335 RepID=A0A1Y3E5L6_9BILA|nr:putative EGF-like domain protein [Trichinella nativa]
MHLLNCILVKHPCPGKFCTERISSCLYPDKVDDSQCTLCPVGYAGYNCETEIDGCLKVECLNGGICFSTGVSTFRCNCPKGFYGRFCESELVSLVLVNVLIYLNTNKFIYKNFQIKT